MLIKKFIIKIASHFLRSLWYYFLHRSTHFFSKLKFPFNLHTQIIFKTWIFFYDFTAGVTFENAQVSDITSVKGLSAFALGELFVLPQTFG